MHKSSV
jgi:hypothetical protein